MRVLIAGAGAIGAYIGARLSCAGVDVTLFARGPHLNAMQQRGVDVRSPDGDFKAFPLVVGSLDEAGPADVVFLCVKSHGLAQLAPLLTPVLKPDTTIVSTQNGVPWWFFQSYGGRWKLNRLERVDPGGVISSAIEARMVVGSIIYFSAEIVAPGVIKHIEGNRISLGEPDGTRSDRIRGIAAALIEAKLKAPITTRIRHEIWVKLLGNVSFNPVSTLTGCTLSEMTRDPDLSQLIRNIMKETKPVGTEIGMELPVSIEQRMSGAEKVGAHKTSMLQDLEAGRPLELEVIVGAVVELGELVGVATPYTRAVYACTKALSKVRRRQIPVESESNAVT
jgi:2-dehydropantoate 2-reductase